MLFRLATLAWLFLLSQPARTFNPPTKETTPSPIANPLLRVCLMREFGHTTQLTLELPAFTQITCDGRTYRMSAPKTWLATAAAPSSITTAGGGVRLYSGDVLYKGAYFLLEPPPDTSPIGLAKQPHGTLRRYRGAIELMQMPGSSTLRVVNILPLESYLRGVIAMEMPPSAPPAALAAQAICARTHALKSRVRFRAQGYDVVDTTACQVYGGMDAERATTDAAVVATKGQVLARKGELIWGDYYDDCGGVTAAGEHEEDYPPSIVDAPKAGEPPFCAQGTYHTWEWTLSPGELVKRLGEARKERLGNIINIAITETDASGRARRVRLEGVHGTEEMKATQLRAMLGYDRLRSTLFTVSRGEGGVFLFKGRGNGHGHGLCQRGAMAMAGPPYNRTMEQILAHYFPGADILPLTSLSTGRE